MPRYNVEQDGLWACFSSIPDAFITPFMPLSEYEKWRDIEYGLSKAPPASSNKMRLQNALLSLSLNKTDEEIVENMRFAGLFYDRKDEA